MLEALNVAIIGSGNRTKKVYYPLFKSLKDYINIVAVCDPNEKSCKELAEKLKPKKDLLLKALEKFGYKHPEFDS